MAAAVDDADVPIGDVAGIGEDVDVSVKYGVEAFFDDVDAIVERF